MTGIFSIIAAIAPVFAWRSAPGKKHQTNNQEQDAEKWRIEEMGISDFQAIAAAGIREQLLRGKGIETTERIA